MRTLMAGVVFWIVVIGQYLAPTVSMAANCRHDSIVRDWVVERDRAEQRVLSQWAKGAQTGDLATDVAIILSNEILICSTCRNEAFLKENLHFLGAAEDLTVETLPGMILERVLGHDILSPHKNFTKQGGLK